MNLIQSTLIHKLRLPRKHSDAKLPALIMLHGRGADEDDLLGLADYLDERLFIISVRAPFQFADTGGFTWFEIEDIGKPESKMFAESYQKLMQFIIDVRKGYPIDQERIFLFGFSMGAMMSYVATLTQPDLFKGVIVNSGLIPEGSGLKYEWGKIKGKPFFVAHGVNDSIVPVAFAKRAKELLEKASIDLTYREYEMDHQIAEESLGDIIKWMDKHL
ncbi:MAG: prolyl oligopeptidase family serine peptidase [Ignavibacteriales bacterium]|nr:prolyl oligopeptidase family serine peptidase [Ignavibacteriales bacterium]